MIQHAHVLVLELLALRAWEVWEDKQSTYAGRSRDRADRAPLRAVPSAMAGSSISKQVPAFTSAQALP